MSAPSEPEATSPGGESVEAVGPAGPGPRRVCLEVAGLTKSFGRQTVLDRVSIDVHRGEVLALLGPSGSGKTTLLRLLAGFETPDGGRIVLDGEDLTRTPASRRGFGLVFQSYALFPHLSVADNVGFGLTVAGWERPRLRQRVREMLELVDLEGFEDRRIAEISGGQQQRVALARALAPYPRLLLLDEPLSNLDPTLRERTREQLRRTLERIDITTVLVTHEQEEAFELGDRVAVLHGGRLQQVATPIELYECPATRFVAGFVGRSSWLQGVVEEAFRRKARVRLRLGEGTAERAVIWTLAGDGLKTGQPVEVMVRPEALEALSQDERRGDALSGSATAVRYGGPVSYVKVTTEGGERLEALLDQPPPLGARLRLVLRPGTAAARAFALTEPRPS